MLSRQCPSRSYFSAAAPIIESQPYAYFSVVQIVGLFIRLLVPGLASSCTIIPYCHLLPSPATMYTKTDHQDLTVPVTSTQVYSHLKGVWLSATGGVPPPEKTPKQLVGEGARIKAMFF